jgi:hypothetical protein
MQDVIESITAHSALLKRCAWIADIETLWIVFGLLESNVHRVCTLLCQHLSPSERSAVRNYLLRVADGHTNCSKAMMTHTYVVLGWVNALQWAFENKFPWHTWTCAYAAEYGHLNVLRWAHEKGCPWDEQVCANAMRNGHYDVLQWARSNGCPG